MAGLIWMTRSVAEEAKKLTCSDEKIQEICNKLQEILELVQEDEPRPQAPNCLQPTDPNPELASLRKYMRECNYTNIYSIATNT